MSEKTEYPLEKYSSKKIGDAIDLDEIKEEEEEEIFEPQQFTWRAAIVGSLLGCVVAASNLYLGLQIGWTFGASLWGSIFGFLILKSLARVTGTIFGPKENCVCQTAATSAGGLSSGFVTAIPAMYRMGLMETRDPKNDVAALILWTICSAFFGMFYAIPLRSYFVINQNLPFPSPRAAAETIKNLHKAGSSAANDARKSGMFLAISFFGSMVWGVAGKFIPGIFDSIHFLYYIGKAAGSAAVMGADTAWGWYFNWEWAFIGAGFMTPGSTVASFILGQIAAFGIAGPLMTSSGYLTGKSGYPLPPAIGSAQSWFLWPGVAMMVVCSFSELGAQAPGIYRGLRRGVFEARNKIRKLQKKEPLENNSRHVSNDPTPQNERIPTYYWVIGITASALLTILVMGLQFHVPVYATIGCLILSFILAFIALQSSGETDINPTGAIAKVTQLVFARIPNDDIKIVQKTNLMCANIVASVCSQSVDMVGDLKTAQLLRASPKAMFWAQMVGSVFAVAVAIPLFMVYTSAYPCILDESIEDCKFATPSVNAWANVCRLLTGTGKVPHESMIASVVLAVLSVVSVIIRVKFLPDAWKPYWINLNAVGIGFINPSNYLSYAFGLGWLLSAIWRRTSRESHEKFMYSVAGGLIAGSGIAGLIKAALTIGGIDNFLLVGCGDGGSLC
ncbi:hypothetical protein BGZ80_008579 [Entomortierella chlamydospora]|uniref:Oligopeptide transporter n=1 Tax=Entomortierella chlamydospora TaxID=101097 RepID=A0A9P6N4K9_9FUNG|nr:hypothetical protein BGZ79_010662 [Entomortierella chlamydospora]KAG0023665.1 hypothetical protein BGZ80_008579 [Entomortierella chlamydospora]